MGYRHYENQSSRVQSISDTMVHFFQSQGIKVMRYNSYTTSSVYLKLDYGMLYTMRISDHLGKKYLNYRYNVTRGYQGVPRRQTDWGWDREFISFNRNRLNEMCLEIIRMRAKKISCLGLYGYQEEMDKRRKKNANQRGFWQKAKDLG
ncbi:hypothetical protein CT113_03830 [Levilactobacillus brevis]|uniref:hypothetical protein n=1 Tax=Levilactobacillus brevis TaxID=1580 RepID=UPI0004661041|nr:hypothetical protein [Levilactobacillus brevis]ATU69515.1 hypothetical protein CT113_03830 [Levilactobacillus brevis]